MWFIRALLGLFLIFLGLLGLVVAFDKPAAITVTFIFIPLGLWVMRYSSRLAPTAAQQRNAEDERKIRASNSFGMRNRLMGIAALVVGIFVMFSLAEGGNWLIEWKPLLGGIMFIVMGGWYLFKGREAEGDDFNRNN